MNITMVNVEVGVTDYTHIDKAIDKVLSTARLCIEI